MKPHQAILGLSLHRPEMLPIIEEWMRRFEVVILEEPPDVAFKKMLAGTMGVGAYVSQLDSEYPSFSHAMCFLLRKLHATGVKILQVEPYLEILLDIHNLFAEGHRPQDLKKHSIQYPVYLAEKNATGALIAYYQAAARASFDDSIEAVLRFARFDAARFRLRDSLRAQALALLIKQHPAVYIEAGLIHYPLWQLINKHGQNQLKVRPVFLADDAIKAMGAKGHLFGPGDQLTLLYMLHPGMVGTARAKLLAAQSIIYSKIIKKEEQKDNLKDFPHIRDELACIQAAKRLSFQDCGRLFPLIRRAKSAAARQIVTGYLADNIQYGSIPNKVHPSET